MGGYGSGNRGHGAERIATDSLLFLDIRNLRKRGYFATGAQPGYEARCDVSWTRRGQPSGSVTLCIPGTEAGAYPPAVRLEYRTQGRGEPTWTDHTERLEIETTPCHYGGVRPWFLCPGCGVRRAVLFSVAGRFRCRGCHKLAYSSTRETAEDRRIRRALAIKRQLGGHKGGTVFDPEPKPPHMHWSTYEGLCAELRTLGQQSLLVFEARFGRLERLFASAPLGLLDLPRARRRSA